MSPLTGWRCATKSGGQCKRHAIIRESRLVQHRRQIVDATVDRTQEWETKKEQSAGLQSRAARLAQVGGSVQRGPKAITTEDVLLHILGELTQAVTRRSSPSCVSHNYRMQ